VVKISKAGKGDLKEYSELRKEWDSEYSRITNQKLKSTDEQIKKEFIKTINDKKRYLLVIRENKEILGYLTATLFVNNYGKFAYIDDVFIIKEQRKRGLATRLIKEFSNILRKRGINSLRLGVNIKNKNALKLYKKLEFKLTHYEMDKTLK
jgi:ribosomal protein S18 acetylase RimI-like enzyme